MVIGFGLQWTCSPVQARSAAADLQPLRCEVRSCVLALLCPLLFQALDRGAALVGADKIATGHNADDVAETVLLNIIRGDVPR